MCNILTAYSFYKLMVLFPVRSFNSNSHVCQHLVWPLQIILKLYIIFSRCIMIRDLRFIMSVSSRPTFSDSTMSSFTIKSGGSWKVTITGFTMLAVVSFPSGLFHLLLRSSRSKNFTLLLVQPLLLPPTQVEPIFSTILLISVLPAFFNVSVTYSYWPCFIHIRGWSR